MCYIRDLIRKYNGGKDAGSEHLSSLEPINNAPLKKGIFFELIFLTILVFLLSHFMIAHDYFEKWHEYTRLHENWELDEWTCILISLLFASFILAQHRLYMIVKMHKRLKETNQRLLEKELEECRQKRLVTLGNMASGLAHEINNALQPALGLGEFIRDDLEKNGNEKHLAYMNTILDGANHAHGILENILQFTHEKAITFEELEAAPLLARSVKFCSDMMPPKTETLWHGLDNIEAPGEQLYMRCNTTSVSQILFNIMKNASYAMDKPGTINIRINRDKIESEENTEIPALRIEISDTGCGMNEETMQRIYDPFFTTKDISEGTGLGLASAYTLMQQHKGEISVRSALEKGTTFTLLFPVIVKPRQSEQGRTKQDHTQTNKK